MKILIGAWFYLPRMGSDVFSAMMKEGVLYDKKLGFKFDVGTDLELAVRTITAGLGEEVELTVRCFLCVPGQTVILGDNKQIRHLREMDQSIGISGLNSIKAKLSRRYSGPMLRIRAAGLLPIELTPEHPVLTLTSVTSRRRTGKNRVQTRTFSGLKWKKASALTPKHEGKEGDYLFIPRVPGSVKSNNLDLADFTNENGRRVCSAKHHPLTIPLNDDTAWLLGIYTAEGFPSSTCARFSLNHDEKEIQQKIIAIGKSLGYSPRKYRLRTSTVVVIPSRILSRALVAWCGKGASNKKVPEFVLLHKESSILKAFLEGYIAGDGYVSEEGSVMSTVSKILALQIQLLAARIGSFVSVSKGKSGSSVFNGRPIIGNPNGTYHMALRPRSSQSYAQVTELGIVTPIRSVQEFAYEGEVHNLETTDHTYLVSNAAVHNCGTEACPGCPYIDVCDRSRVSPLCLCEEHSPEKDVYELYKKTYAASAAR